VAVGSLEDVRVAAFDDGDGTEWDELVAAAPMATFLHSRRFLNYHGDRFADQSLLLRDGRSRLLGVFPAATDPTEPSRVVSHPGLTYGGVLHTGSLGGAGMTKALGQIRVHYAERGFQVIRYKAVPHIYHRRPSMDDLYALWGLEARLYRCDLSSAIDLQDRARPAERRRRGARKALARGVEVLIEADSLEDFWSVLEENLATRHGVRPTHSTEEMRRLIAIFPDSIDVVTAKLDNSVVAGLVLFKTERVAHAQYIGATDAGRSAFALDALLEHCIELAGTSGIRFFDFGISTEAEGRLLNEGLHKFKSEFGGGGVAHLFYDLDCTAGSSVPAADPRQS
jgi:Acetyltransferase (GNAT) domain